MKSIILFFSLLFSLAISAQETTTNITKTSDTTFVQTNVTTYGDGRIVTEEIPFDLEGFANLVVEQNINHLIQIDARNAANITAQRDVNQLKNYINDSLSVNYDSLLQKKGLIALTGNWKLIERNGSNITTNVSVAAHNSNPAVLRMTNEDGPGGWNLKTLHTHKFEIRSYGVASETVEMQLTQFANFTGYLGKTNDGKTLILRR